MGARTCPARPELPLPPGWSVSAHYPAGDEPTQEQLLGVLGEVADALDRAGIEHVFMGGIGAFTMARPRVTNDIDLFVRPGDAHEVLRVLAAAGFEVEEHDGSWLFKAWKHGVLVDVVFRSSGDIYLDDEMLERAEDKSFKGLSTKMIAPEDLLVIKALSSNEPTPQHWYDALALIARCDLDWRYLIRRAREAGPRRVLSLLIYAESCDYAVPTTAIAELYETVHPSPAH
jgi:predicted nucleotidyltransferase